MSDSGREFGANKDEEILRVNLRKAQAEITRLREELESMTLERNTYRDRVEDLKLAAKAGLALAKGSKETEDKLMQENERLRKDAERLDWLRKNFKELDYWAVMRTGRHDINAAIDAAKEAE